MRSSTIQRDMMQIIAVLNGLMHCYREKGGWVPLRRLAKECEGSEEYVVKIAAIIDLPEYREIFVKTKNVVKLSEQGERLLDKIPATKPLYEEIMVAIKDYAAGLKRVYIKASQIHSIASTGGKHVHALEVEMVDKVFPTGTPVELHSHETNTPYHGTVVGSEDDGVRLYVAFNSKLTPDEAPATLSLDRGFLTRQLANRFEGLEFLEQVVAKFTDRQTDQKSIADEDSAVVAGDLAVLPAPWHRFLWGPPGSGKTFAIARLVCSLLKQEPGTSVLLVAPSNRAIDVVILEILSSLDGKLHELFTKRRILRFGYPKDTAILSNAMILGPEKLDDLSSQIKSIAKQMADAKRHEADEAELSVLRTRLLSVQEEIKSSLHQHALDVDVLATTTASAYLDNSPVHERMWDTVIVDEATMVPPAACVYLATRASHRMLLVGDPRQLGPVFQENKHTSEISRKWLGTDIFQFSGLTKVINSHAHRGNKEDGRLVRITSQRRCAQRIWEIVEHLYPRVISSPGDSGPYKELFPCPGRALVVIDTSGLAKKNCCEKCQRSWQNILNAKLCLQLTRQLLKSGLGLSIAIITPYRAQVQLIKSLLRIESDKDIAITNVQVGTIHQFQGSEADVILFDLVDGPGRASPGYLLCGDNGLRLVNVAVTRAKHKVMVVADRSWFLEHFTRERNPLLWDLITKRKIDEFSEVSGILK